MFWYLSIAIATKLRKMAEVQISERKDKAVHWTVVIPNDGTENEITMGRQENDTPTPSLTSAL